MRLPPVAAARLPRTLGQYQYGQLLSTFIASYSYVNVIPSWANEMTPGVKVKAICWVTASHCSLAFYFWGEGGCRLTLLFGVAARSLVSCITSSGSY